jgi:uncharacterized protein (TIGR04255 family)
VQRVIYERNPLEEVICQLRFPQILRIGTEPPAEFQEHIRADFPIYSEEEPIGGLPTNLPAELRGLIKSAFQVGTQFPTRRFSSGDGTWTVSLASDFIALSTTAYVRWEDFRNRLRGPLEALAAVYAPAFFSRIGLRYRDLICRSRLGLQQAHWSELLQPHIAAELTDENVPVVEALHQVICALSGDRRVRLVHGLRRVSEEQCYTIDADFFTEERTEIPDATTVLTDFNREARRLFGWCISPRLHDAMVPRAIQSVDTNIT